MNQVSGAGNGRASFCDFERAVVNTCASIVPTRAAVNVAIHIRVRWERHGLSVSVARRVAVAGRVAEIFGMEIIAFGWRGRSSQFGAGVVRRAHGRGACTGEGAPRGFLRTEGGRTSDEVKAVSLSFITRPFAFRLCLQHPSVAARIVCERAVGVLRAKLFVAREQSPVAPLG